MLVAKNLEHSKALLLSAIGDEEVVTLLRPPGDRGNIGNELIYAGARRLLSDRTLIELPVECPDEGRLAVILGSGRWCHHHHEAALRLAEIEERYDRVIVFPSSFDLTCDPVRHAVARTKAILFARDLESYAQLRQLNPRVCAAFDTAFFFGFEPYLLPEAKGILNAYRRDDESAGGMIPEHNIDISSLAISLDHWLWLIAKHEVVRTDRAMVMIAAAMLKKRVFWRPSSYHKVGSIAAYSLRGLPVFVEETIQVAVPRI